MGLESLELEDGQKTPPQKPRSTPRVLLLTPGPERRLSRSATTPGSKIAGTPGSKSAGTPGVERRSDRLRQRLVDIVKGSVGGIGETKTTPKGSNIHSEMMFQPQFARIELENFKRRLQFKNGTRANLVMEEAFKDLERKEKMKDFMVDQRGKRDLAQFKSRGLSLPAISRTRQTSLLIPTGPGEAPKVQFIPRVNLRSQSRPVTIVQHEDEISNLEISKSNAATDKRKQQYKQTKTKQTKHSLEFASWKDRDDKWRTKRMESYISASKTAREATLFKKRNLTICGWGNAQKNLGNYLSITWDYMPCLDADPDHSLPGRNPVALHCVSVDGVMTEKGIIFHPETTDCEDERLQGYVFTIQSELAIRYEAAQRELFDQASRLVRESFLPYQMDLSLDSSLDDNFTIEIYVSSKPSDDESQLTVRGVTQFIFMKEYIYVDKICVSKEHQKIGIGAFMMERIKKLASERKKDVLLYALGPVIDVYTKWGFTYCKEWPPIPNDVGAIMRGRVHTYGVADDYEGPKWNGTEFV